MDANGQLIGSCTVKLKGMNALMEIHPAILSWLGNNWEIEIGNHCTTLDCYTEMKNINKGTLYHAHPNYHNGRPWQDWAMAGILWYRLTGNAKESPIQTVAILQTPVHRCLR
jgi:hypothetical protein